MLAQGAIRSHGRPDPIDRKTAYTDYWLFSLEVPPAGYEWVREDNDAVLVNTSNGEILQVEYGAFG
jgi:Ni/Co efflux regulator RcnB